AAFREGVGYNPSVLAGEEPEMCVRLRARGWKIHRIDTEMTLHNAAMTRFGQWWTRNVRAGHAYAEGFAMHGGQPEHHWVREVRSNWFWSIAPLAACGLALVSFLIFAPRWIWIGFAPLLLYPLQMLRVFLRARHRASARNAIAYAFFVVLGKFPQALGQLTY